MKHGLSLANSLWNAQSKLHRPILGFGLSTKALQRISPASKTLSKKCGWDQSQLVYLRAGCWDEATSLPMGQCLPWTQLLRLHNTSELHIQETQWSLPLEFQPQVRSVTGLRTYSQTLFMREIIISGMKHSYDMSTPTRTYTPTLSNSLKTRLLGSE